FRPTSHEMRRLLGRKLGAKIKYSWPMDNVFARRAQADHRENQAFNGFVVSLSTACKEAFPVKMDMTKIAMCKQQPGESVSQYLTRPSL
ncbi:uncharacterized protein DAT39_017842, partial [Clarias magur]